MGNLFEKLGVTTLVGVQPQGLLAIGLFELLFRGIGGDFEEIVKFCFLDHDGGEKGG